ncbi:MAG: DUF4062 domain-containing protein [Armatimonadota bacterium]
MKKKYQVFVSSTFLDLQEERKEVMQALLELNCIPSGMELFPAANEDQWTLIKKVIDDCDYYIVIIAGRYGSLGPHGLSYTEMEYRYALDTGKPVIGFYYHDTGKLPQEQCEQEPERREKLDAFLELVRKKMCKSWTSPEDLGGKVSRGIIRLMNDYPAIGWVRGDMVPDESSAQEILILQKKVGELQKELSDIRGYAPEGTENLAQGDDKFTIMYNYILQHIIDPDIKINGSCQVNVTWNDLFAAMSPYLIDEASESSMRNVLDRIMVDAVIEDIKNTNKDFYFKSLNITEESFQVIKVQFRALKLITEKKRNRNAKDVQTYWTLTPYGDAVMTRLRAITK